MKVMKVMKKLQKTVKNTKKRVVRPLLHENHENPKKRVKNPKKWILAAKKVEIEAPGGQKSPKTWGYALTRSSLSKQKIG